MASVYRVEETLSAVEDYCRIEDWLTEVTGDPDIAMAIVQDIRPLALELTDFPHRGTRRDDLAEGLRILPFRRKGIIAFDVDDDAGVVTIRRIFYGDEDYETLIQSAKDNP